LEFVPVCGFATPNQRAGRRNACRKFDLNSSQLGPKKWAGTIADAKTDAVVCSRESVFHQPSRDGPAGV
jgi:hypothetical protein